MAHFNGLLKLLLAGSALFAQQALADTMSMTVDGAKQGLIKGESTVAGKANSITVESFTYGVQSAFDAASGLATGKRQHQPLSVVKLMDATSIALMNAMVTNENLPSVVLTIVAPVAGPVAGKTGTLMTITLTNARVSSIAQGAVNAAGQLTETVQFTFQKIEEQSGSLISLDNWSASAP